MLVARGWGRAGGRLWGVLVQFDELARVLGVDGGDGGPHGCVLYPELGG